MVQLRAAPVLHAECGTDVSLKCEVSSPKQGLSVKYLGWSLNAAPLCFLTENSPINQSESLRRFHCMYSHGHLSLVLHNAQPRDGGNYACKLRSNKGTAHAATRVEFKGQSAYLIFFEIIMEKRKQVALKCLTVLFLATLCDRVCATFYSLLLRTKQLQRL